MPYLDNPADGQPGAPSAVDLGGPGPRRITVISASMGAGHDGAATELTRHLTALGFLVDRHDFLDLLPAGIGKLLCGAYLRLLTWAPTGYQRIYAATEHDRRPGLAVRLLLRGARRRTLATVTPETRAVVSTYPGASQVLGALRLRGRLGIPALTYLTDFSVHSLWVAPGIDAHLAAHAIPAAQAHEQGATGVTVTGPLTDPRFTPATEDDRRAARARFGLPEDAPLALLVAGSWGVGPVREAAAEIRDTGAALPVVVCGHNHALAERLRADGITHVHEWVDDMPGLMHACDVLVQNAGGLTSLEALASGLPVVSYRCIPGHGQTNAAALEEAGLAPWIREPGRLAPTLTQLLHGPRRQAQRAAGLALYTSAASGPAQTVVAMARRPLSVVRKGERGRTVAVPSEALGLLAAAVPSDERGLAAAVPSKAPGLPLAALPGPSRRRSAVRRAIPGLPAAVRRPAPALTAAVRSAASVLPGAVRAAAPGRPAVVRSSVRAPGETAAARLAVTAPRHSRRRMILMAVAVAATVSLGIGAPLADAYGEAPGHHLGALTHYLEDDDR
ncbi:MULTISPECIES: MGDG synthase family glycosyltransferase [unclassified Streptomyces]|uniref:MGDG synthase family glycosyltransferase n=1 Tax=unclassified Streptomyces TaxID=2593676 RepID=UPI002E812A83|nr:glycosyltransferase [Streptomyces sp. NBC_00589]WTI37165.1 glycosyltransferase [Streptomyces sp. NBC_00775]WUB29159.1 glycosyltransferase [Streptomyces sp. NBC_00589]